MAWIEMHQSLLTHRKTWKAAKLLGITCVNLCGHLYVLWSWALDNAPDGRIEPDDVAKAAQYAGDAGEFLAALIDAGFIDRRRNGSLWLHDWKDYGGKLCEQRKKNAAKNRSYRQRKKENEAAALPSRDSHETGTATVTLPAREEKTRVEKSREDTPPYPPHGGRAGDLPVSHDTHSLSVEPDEYGTLFDLYPRHEKRVAGAALYARYSTEEQASMMTAVRNYAAYVRYFEKEQDRIMLITTFLSWDRRPWLDWTREENAKWAVMPPGCRRNDERDPALTPGVKGGKYAGIVYQ